MRVSSRTGFDSGATAKARSMARPRRILIIDDALAFGGSIVSTANLIRVLERTRYCAYFVTSTTKEHARSKLREAGSVTPTYAAHKLCTYNHLLKLGEYLDPVRLRIYPVFVLLNALVYAARLGVNLPYMLKIAALILSQRIDVVQLNNGFANEEAALVARLLRRPITVFFRGYGKMGTLARGLGLNRLERYVAVSAYIKEQAIADGIPEDAIVVATPPAMAGKPSTSRDAIRTQLGIKKDSFVIGSVGRVIPWKGCLEFANAVAGVLSRHPDAVALIVGGVSDGEQGYLDQVIERFRQFGVSEQVIMTGYVDNVDDYYSAMDVVVHSAIEPEPSGRVVLEAMAHGVPIIASDLGGPKEFIEEGVDGFIVNPHDFEKVAARIESLRTEVATRDSMGKAGRRKAQTSYSAASYADTVQNAYDRYFPS